MSADKLNILFIHQNFPAQYKHLAVALAEDGHNVMALGNRQASLPGVTVVPYRYRCGPSKTIHPVARELEVKVIRGDSIVWACRALKDKGFTPDLVYVHPGWGEALFLRDLYPDAKLVMYCEYYYRLHGQDVNFDPEFPFDNFEEQCRLRLKNTCNLHALEIADAGLAPTKWQRDTYPEHWRDLIEVIHDGIDTTVVKPDPKAAFSVPGHDLNLTRSDLVITFVARDLEPLRGVHPFIRALPMVLEKLPKAQVLVIGSDGVSYGRRHDSGSSWREVYMKEVDTKNFDRVSFLGRIDYPTFLTALQVSRVHVSLSYPFVLSWSTLEAVACGAHVLGADTGPIQEFLPPAQRMSFFDPEAIADKIIKSARSSKKAPKKLPDWVEKDVSLERCLERHKKLVKKLCK